MPKYNILSRHWKNSYNILHTQKSSLLVGGLNQQQRNVGRSIL